MKKKKKRKVKNQSLIKGIFPKSLGKAYIDFKKQQDANKLKKIKLEEREEAKRLVQERKDLRTREEKIEKEEDRLKLKEEELYSPFKDREEEKEGSFYGYNEKSDNYVHGLDD